MLKQVETHIQNLVSQFEESYIHVTNNTNPQSYKLVYLTVQALSSLDQCLCMHEA